MAATKILRWVVALVVLLSLSCAGHIAHATEILRGVNFVHPLQFNAQQQESRLAELQTLSVRVIRFGVYAEDAEKNIGFIKLAHSHNISVVLILHGLYAPGAPFRQYNAKQFPGMFAGSPFSSLDPESSRQNFQELMNKLDGNGIVLAGLELENEINMAGNNPDFNLPGEGRVLGLVDLANDPEGKQVARGYLQYLKVLAALKQVRDQSRLNRHTPLLPFSLVDIEQEGPWPTPKKYDGVSVAATLGFLRTHGLDTLVDAYNLHTYPWADNPGNQASAIHRMRRLESLVSAVCSPGGKPCWITEWGFSYATKACSASEDHTHTLLVQEMMGDFHQLVQQGRLTALIYYSWIGDTQFDVNRCGSLTEAGKRAISPL